VLTRDARLACDGADFSFLDEAPAAALVRVAIDRSDAAGLRPDGRLVVWARGALITPVQERSFIDVVAGYPHAGCGLTADHRVHCWDGSSGFPQE
jgi:hypothetical protein